MDIKSDFPCLNQFEQQIHCDCWALVKDHWPAGKKTFHLNACVTKKVVFKPEISKNDLKKKTWDHGVEITVSIRQESQEATWSLFKTSHFKYVWKRFRAHATHSQYQIIKAEEQSEFNIRFAAQYLANQFRPLDYCRQWSCDFE